MKSSFMLVESKREKKESYGFSMCVGKYKIVQIVQLCFTPQFHNEIGCFI